MKGEQFLFCEKEMFSEVTVEGDMNYLDSESDDNSIIEINLEVEEINIKEPESNEKSNILCIIIDNKETEIKFIVILVFFSPG